MESSPRIDGVISTVDGDFEARFEVLHHMVITCGTEQFLRVGVGIKATVISDAMDVVEREFAEVVFESPRSAVSDRYISPMTRGLSLDVAKSVGRTSAR